MSREELKAAIAAEERAGNFGFPTDPQVLANLINANLKGGN